MRPPAELGNISCFILLKNSVKVNESLLRRIMKKFGMKVMKNHDTLNGTLKNDNLTDNELTLLSILLSNPSISLSDASDRMGISRRTVSRIVASLQDKEIVERKKSKKEGSWRIVK
ncbi:MAG: MarR family transcriptional regulator [Clostridium sp.]|nr:MarR family transcriptional regulator [Clostridium sp.]